MTVKETAKDFKAGFVDGVVSVTRVAGVVFTVAVGVKLGLLAAATLDSVIIPKS